jgi:hypothetical protein
MDGTSRADHAPRFDLSKLKWNRTQDLSDPAVPIDVSTAVVGGNAELGRIDFIVWWEPNCYCPFHRHMTDTISIVLEGEHHIETTKDSQTVSKVRPPGHYGCTPGGDAHMERAGPNGSLVFFSAQAKDGRVFESLDAQGNVTHITTVADMLSAL